MDLKQKTENRKQKTYRYGGHDDTVRGLPVLAVLIKRLEEEFRGGRAREVQTCNLEGGLLGRGL